MPGEFAGRGIDTKRVRRIVESVFFKTKIVVTQTTYGEYSDGLRYVFVGRFSVLSYDSVLNVEEYWIWTTTPLARV